MTTAAARVPKQEPSGRLFWEKKVKDGDSQERQEDYDEQHEAAEVDEAAPREDMAAALDKPRFLVRVGRVKVVVGLVHAWREGGAPFLWVCRERVLSRGL